MTDKELLELAAKASRIALIWPLLKFSNNFATPYIRGESTRWNPLTDDSDAFRLAVKLGIHIGFYGDHVSAQSTGYELQTVQSRDGNMEASTRCAIVRAAAEISKNMEGV